MDNTRAAYRVLSPNGFYGPDDHLYIVSPDGDYPEIYFDGEPNEEMEPLNDLARERVTAYLNKLDDLARIAAEKAGRQFVGRPRTLDGQVALASEMARENMSIMGARKEVSTVDRVEANVIPQTSLQNPRRGRGRPKMIRDTAA